MRVPMRVANRVLTHEQWSMLTQRIKATELVQRMQRTVKRASRRVPAPLTLVGAR